MSAINEALKKARRYYSSTSTGNGGDYSWEGNTSSSATKRWSRSLLVMALGCFVLGIVSIKKIAFRDTPVPSHQAGPRERPSRQEAKPTGQSIFAEDPLLPIANTKDFSVSEREALSREPLPVTTTVETAGNSSTPKGASGEKAADPPKLRLQGIFFQQEKPFVVINSKTLTTGQEVEGVTVQTITQNSVILKWRGITKTLTLR